MTLVSGVIIVIVCIILEGFFAGSEMGVISCNRIRITALADRNDRRAKIIMSFLEDPEKFLGTTLVGVNIAVVVGSSVATMLVSKYINTHHEDALIATLMLFPLVLVFGEMIPKAVYQRHADRMALISAYPLKAVSAALSPLVFLATGVSAFISRLFARGGAGKNPYVSREEIRLLLVEGAKEGVLDRFRAAMASEIFDFGKTSVQSVMVPLSNVISAPDISSVKEVTELIIQSGYSRIPVYREKEENIIGVIAASDLAAPDIENTPLEKLIRLPYKVEWNRPIGEMLKDFQHNGEDMAVVTDKDKKAVGIATIEDIVEEIVGEIEDEYDVGA